MPSVIRHHDKPPDRILVIDDLPLIPLAFQEIFRSLNQSASCDYCSNIYTALSAKTYEGADFDLVILGSVHQKWATGLEQTIRELQDRFGHAQIMLYSGVYDPALIEKMETAGIQAYVHRYEAIEEIRDAYRHLSAGTRFISSIFRTLYNDYGYGKEMNQ